MLETADITPSGAFMKWGIMKDVFVPVSQMNSRMKVGESYFILLFIDDRTGRVTGTEKIDRHLSNNNLSVKEQDQVDLLVFQKTDIGYKVIINSKHLGLLHFNEVFRELNTGEKLKGFIKHIRPDSKIDVVMGAKGYEKVGEEENRILSLLRSNNGYLPYDDKSDPDEIHAFFGISKKTFKMSLGALYKKKLITFTQSGIKLEE
jgi:predicted RNA-binding protein (virulence factor B family)